MKKSQKNRIPETPLAKSPGIKGEQQNLQIIKRRF